MKELKHLNKYLFKYKYLLLLGTIFIIISNIFVIIPAQVVRYSVDIITADVYLNNMFDGFDIQEHFGSIFIFNIVICALAILVMALLRGTFLFLVRQTVIVMSRHIEYDLKNEIYAHYQTLPLSFYRKNNTGDLMARISEDVSKVRMYLGPAIMYGINLISLFLMVIPIMFLVNAKLTLYSLLPLPILSISIYYVSDIMNRRSEEIQRSLSGLSTYVQEAFSGVRVLKAFVRENSSVQEFAKESSTYKDKSLRLTFVNALFFPLIMSLIGLSVILTIFIGGTQVINGTITFGNIAEFIMYVNILTWPVTALGWVTSIIQRAEASQERINEFLNIKTDIVSRQNVQKPIQGKITFDEVGFVYEDSGIEALDKVSFSVNPGESLAIIGTTGSGKSTVANLIPRMFDSTSGAIYIDDVDIQDYDLSNLRKQIGYVPQDVFLFSDTIKDNIGFGNGNLPEEKIVQASKDADLFDNISQFKDGFDTRIGERGISLSGGQKQRVSIARALVRDPQILILDDCLSAVDTKTENAILNSLKKIMIGKTSIIISHRVSSAKLADKVIVLDNGRIIEQGTNESLLASNGVYKELYDKQLQADEVEE
ncbi:ABC transporter ATP-binding protein [Fulvivirgaceae bacterium BMA10]|uniref:ABC transporter ATP-binding protein n=1 Tax=Splendidivirga corallicola TaxID=3051826 RepID=A0ABT8KJ27_9BACT|nr:ABC transporter ATP-binding protein [Fulvivirgaceae bacterium BMA10]